MGFLDVTNQKATMIYDVVVVFGPMCWPGEMAQGEKTGVKYIGIDETD